MTTRWSPERARAVKAPSPGRALFVGTPKGFNFFYDLFNYKEVDPLWNSYQYDYTQSPLLDPNEIEKLRDQLDPVEFASEYLASFKESGHSVFYCFDRTEHVTSDVPYFVPPQGNNKGEDVHIGIDFNVGLMCSSVFAIRGNQMHFLDEFKGFSDTEQLAIAIVTKYKGHKIFAYPDPTGKARKSSAPVGRTDLSILKSYGIIVLARTGSPPIIDSVAAVNKKLKTASGFVSMYVHPRCKGLIQSLERTRWVDNKPDTATIDKSDGVEHFSDSVRYPTEFLYPVGRDHKKTKRGFQF